VNAEFNWWLLIVGLVVGAGLVWLVLADSARKDADVNQRERAGEARWIGQELRRAGRPVSDDQVLDVLELHEAYLAAPPPDEPSPLDASDQPRSAERSSEIDREPLGSADAAEDRIALQPRRSEVDERHPEAGVRG
jgi:hypothetical protein